MTTPLEAAQEFIARGWNPVPIAWRTKKPIGADWHLRKIDTGNVAEHFDGGQLNVGVILGPSSAGLCDVDLDCREAIAIAPFVLSPTPARFGRTSKRDSHYLYVTDLASKTESAVFQFRHPNTGEMLLELRVGGGGRGAQTVFPGSTHDETGERISWDEDGAPAVVAGGELFRKVKEVAAYCLIARYWPAHGARHVAAQALGGVLGRLGPWRLIDNAGTFRGLGYYLSDPDKTQSQEVNISKVCNAVRARGPLDKETVHACGFIIPLFALAFPASTRGPSRVRPRQVAPRVLQNITAT
jgi:hypothetical protein